MGNRIVHVGTQGMGISLKIVLNLLLATSMAAFSEGMVLGQALGIPQDMLFSERAWARRLLGHLPLPE